MNQSVLLPTTKVCLSDQQSSVSFSGEQVLLNHTSGTYYGLNSSGAFIWELMGSPDCTIALMLETLLTRYEIAPEQAEEDLMNLLHDLEKEGLVSFKNE